MLATIWNGSFGAGRRSTVVLILVLAAALTLGAPLPGQALPFLSGAGDSRGDERASLAPMLEKVMPAVVNISTRGRVEVKNPLAEHPFFNDPFFRRFFGMPDQSEPERYRETQSLGSGVIVDAEQGYILTNSHVVERADEVTVTLVDEREFKAKIVGIDSETDVAVLKVDADDLTALPVADADTLKVGDFVVAIGNPFGLQHTVTSGIISALGRSGIGNPDQFQDYIQTDASINPGNSGGALVDFSGELVGINTAILSQSGGNIGIGFAIPADIAMQVMKQLIEYGEVRRGRLGVVVQNLTPELAKALGVPVSKGVVVTKVQPGTSADEAGLKPEDVIIEVNGEAVDDYRDLRNAIGLLRVGDRLELRIIRNGSRKRVTTKVGSAPGDEPRASAQEPSDGAAAIHPKLAGATFAAADSQGVEVVRVEPGSPAAYAGLRPGDVITAVNRKPVSSVEAFRSAAGQSERLLLSIQRGEGALFLLIQ